MSHLRLLWINGSPVERRDPITERRRLPVVITKEGCRIAWLVLPMAASAALPPPAGDSPRKPRTVLRRACVAIILVALMTLVFNVIAAVGIHGVLSRSTPSTSLGSNPPVWGVRDGQS